MEDSELNLCVVPENWKKNGLLFWSLGRKGMNLRKDDNYFDCKIIIYVLL